MDTAAKILFGKFPTTVAAAENGELSQTFVHSESEFDLFFNKNKSNKNVYANISKFRSDMRPITGDIPFDFDSPMKDSAFDEGDSASDKMEKMRSDEELAKDVLGLVWNDTQSLVKHCRDNDIPVISVFSGMGVHCHLLYQERVNPTEEKFTTSKKLVEECDLNTWDRKIVTDTKRILRVPNSQRIENGEAAGAWCIPLTEKEVLANSIHDILERSYAPKSIPLHSRYEHDNRPKMQVYEGIELDENAVGSVELEERDISSEVSEEVQMVVENCIGLPCVRERFLRSNPDHMIRFTGVALLYQAGFRPRTVQNLIREIGWMDYDRDITKKMTEQIWERGYSECSCEKLQSLGLCVYGPSFEDFSDDPKDCDWNGYKSGQALYPYD